MVTPETLKNGAIPMELPEGVGLPFVRAHNCYHASGLRHLCVEEDKTPQRGWLRRPVDLRKPLWLATMAMGRGGAATLRAPLNAETMRCRFQFEFWLSPAGEFEFPIDWAHFLSPEPVSVPLPIRQCMHTITQVLLLVVKYGIHPAGGFSDLEPGAECIVSAFDDPSAAPPG